MVLLEPYFYTMPKDDKEEIPGKLIISSVNWQTSKLLECIDYHLQPIVREISSLIKRANYFPCQLKVTTEDPENSYIAALFSFLKNFANFTERNLR